MEVPMKSPMTGEINTMNIDVTQRELDRISQLKKDNCGHLIDRVVKLPFEQADFLVTGIPPHEWETNEDIQQRFIVSNYCH